MLWTDKTIKEFWASNQAGFAGDSNSKEIVRLTRKHIKGRVLDVGAGSGKLVSLIPEAIGIDIVPKGKGIIEGNITQIPFGDESFDTVFACDMLEHLDIETINHGIEEIKRVLRKNGRLIAVVPYCEDFKQNLVYCPSCKARFHRWGHQQVFSEIDMHILFNTESFRLIDEKIIPLSMMVEHWIISYFWRLFVMMGILKKDHIIIVAEKR